MICGLDAFLFIQPTWTVSHIAWSFCADVNTIIYQQALDVWHLGCACFCLYIETENPFSYAKL